MDTVDKIQHRKGSTDSLKFAQTLIQNASISHVITQPEPRVGRVRINKKKIRGFTMVVGAGRLREWSQGELQM